MNLTANIDLPTDRQVNPYLTNCRTVEVLAGITWEATLGHRIYSCPDIPDFDFVLGATTLILKNRHKGLHVSLEVCSVMKLAANNFAGLEVLSQEACVRVEKYLAEVIRDERIIRPGCAHRFYILSTEPAGDFVEA